MTRDFRYPPNAAIIQDRDRLGYWLPRVSGQNVLAIDTETTGLNWGFDRVKSLCVAANDTALYITDDALAPSVHWLADQVKSSRDLVFHGAKYDMHMLWGTFGLRIPRLVHDTSIQSFLIDDRGALGRYFGGHGLKNLAQSYVDPRAHLPEDRLRESVIEHGGKRGKETWKGDMFLGDDYLVGVYGLMDPWFTLKLHEIQMERIIHWTQPDSSYPSLLSLYETERWLLLALTDMERQGILVETSYFEEWQRDLEKELAQIKSELIGLAGKEINWNSAPQLRKLLYDDLDIPVERWTQPKKNSKSEPQPSTDEVALTDMNHPIASVLLRFRAADKQYGTYAKGLLEATWSDGRIHANFRQTGARTGRLSCAEPNLQQMTRASEEKPGPRRGFVPDPGLELRFADYSQVEMRFAAHSSNDPTLVKGFVTDPDFDVHSATAKKMWGLIGQPTKVQRKFAKIMNFAILFGAGIDKITSQLIAMLTYKEAVGSIKMFGAPRDRSISPHRQLAGLLMDVYFREFPAVKGRKYESTKAAKELGYAMNQFGRHRYLTEEEAYKAFNTEIQGTAADLSKRALANVYRELQHTSGQIALLLQVHDELGYLTDGDPKIDRQVLEIMNENSQFRVPIVAEISGSKTSWQEKRDIKLAA